MEHELNSIITGDSLIVLKSFPDESLDLVITSPPYFQQREYGGTGLGNETTEQAYLDNLLAVFSECVRTTKATGAIVFNLGDKYIDGSLSLLPYKFAIQAQRRVRTNESWFKPLNRFLYLSNRPATHSITMRSWRI
jgi:DNA modification methylase